MTIILPGGLGQIKPAAGGSAFDPATLYVSTNATLSNGNKTLTSVGSGSTTSSGVVKGIKSHNSGKYYFEMAMSVETTVGANGNGCGLCNSSFATSSGLPGSDTGNNSWGIAVISGSWWIQSGNSQWINMGAPVAGGDTCRVAVDFSQGYIWFGLNGLWSNNNSPSSTLNTATPDFAPTGSGPPAGTTLWPVGATTAFQATRTCTIVTGAPFTYALPSGFLAWG